jgi:zinc D-Ala-D-Ala carboxypeptidase
MTKLSKNFSLHEMIKSETAVRYGMDNMPSATEVENLKALVENVLQPVRDRFGPTHVSSGYRHPLVNAKVGGSVKSDHCQGMAADIEVPGMANYDLAKWIEEHLEFTQCILEFYTPGIPDSGWVHVSYNPADLKKQTLTATRKGGRVVYAAGLEA